MTDPSVAYFFRKFYRNIIKWWYVVYNPKARVVSYAPEDEAYTKQIMEEKEKRQKERARKYALAYGLPLPEEEEISSEKEEINDTNYNKTTGSFSGLYGQAPVDDSTKSVLDEIMGKSNHDLAIAHLIQEQEEVYIHAHEEPVTLPPEQNAVVSEANEIYERLLREAAEDEERKKAEIEAAKAAQNS